MNGSYFVRAVLSKEAKTPGGQNPRHAHASGLLDVPETAPGEMSTRRKLLRIFENF